MSNDELALPIPKGCSIPTPIGEAVDVVAEIWRATRDDEVARRLVTLSEEYAFYFGRRLPKKGPMFGRIVSGKIDRLLSVLLRSVTHGTDARAGERLLLVLESWTATDPRIRLYVDRWSNAHPYPNGYEFLIALTQTLDAASSMEQQGRPLRDDEHAAIGRADNVIASLPKRRIAFGLLEDVYANPHDVQRRLVLADALMDLGDSWGELIAMQCSSTNTSTPKSGSQAQREKELLAAHGQEWLGRLGPQVADRPVTFEQGFPAIVSPNPMGRATGIKEWSTVRQLESRYQGSYGAEVWTLSLLGRLPSLRQTTIAVETSSKRREPPHLPFRNTSLEHLSLRVTAYGQNERVAAFARLRGIRTFPKLKRLDILDYGQAQTAGVFNAILNMQTGRFGKSIREIGLNDPLRSILERLAPRMADGQALPTLHSLVDHSSISWNHETRELTLRLGKSIDMRVFSDLVREAKAATLRVEAVEAAWKQVEARQWQSSLGGVKLDLKRLAAAN